MKHLKRITVLSGLLALGTGHAWGQAASNVADDESVVELSPFEVTGSEDVGYQATNTLAGSRINTELKDLGASITVLTPEFLEDLGATDIETAFAYIASVETNLTVDSSSAVNGYMENSSHTAPGNNRVRGLARADVTADFFRVGNGNLDTYNVERITLVRGPNSVLFGLGSPAGIIDYTTKKAQFRNMNEVEFRFDNFGSTRSRVDFNREVVDDILAVRLMGLYEDGRSQFDRTFDRDQRFTGALTFTPFKSTTIRLGVETSETRARRARYLAPQDNISGWIAAGRPTWNAAANVGLVPADVYSDPQQARAFRVLDGVSAQPFTVFTDMNSTVPDFASFTRNVDQTGASIPQANRVQFYSSADPAEGTYEVDTQVGDPRIFPVQDVDLASTAGSKAFRQDDKFWATWSQAIIPDLQFEVGYYEDRTVNDNFNHIFSQTSSIQIDVNETLPNGQTNPNFLRPFVYGRGIGNYADRKSEQFRTTVSYQFDFDEKFDRIGFLGKHNFTGLFSSTEETVYDHVWEPKISVYGPVFDADVNLQRSTRRVGSIYYVGDPFTPDMDFPRYTGFPNVGLALDQPFNLDYYNASTGTWTVNDPSLGGPAVTQQERLVHNPPTDASKLEVEGFGGSWQGSFWNDRIVATLGWRRDEVSSWTINGPPPGDNGLVSIDLSDPDWQFPAEPDYDPVEGETITRGAVFHATDWLSFHYNESENFAVGRQLVDIFRRPIANSGGEGTDWGFSVYLMDNKLSAKVNFFETAQVNANTGAFGFTSSWGVQSVERQLYGYLRRNGRLDEWVHPFGDKDPNNPPYDANYLKPSNVGDVNDFVSEGTEFELTYNPTPNWRLAFNFTEVETVQANSAGALIEYNEGRLPYLQQFFNEQRNPRQTWGEWHWIRIGKPLANAQAANGKSSVALPKYSANFVTNYAFREGRLRGFSIGGNFRWREGAAIGYPDFVDPDGVVRSDLDNPYIGPDSINVGMQMAYRKRIMNDKVDWKIQLNIQNLIEEDDLIENRINPDGNVASWRIGRDRVFMLSNQFKF